MSFHQDALPHRMRAIQQPLTEEPPAECQCCSDDFLCDVLTCSSLNESQSSISVRSSSDTSSNHLSNSSTDLITTRDAEGSGSEVLASADNEPVSSGTPTGRTSPQSHPPNKRHQHRHKYLADAVSANHDEGDHNASDIVCNEANEFNSNGKGKMKTKLRKSKDHSSHCVSLKQHHRRYHHHQVTNSPSRHVMSNDPISKRANTSSLWLQLWQPSYKTRLNQFQRQFSDISLKEKLIDDFLCALQRDILCQGRLYVSLNFISFYSNILGYETVVTINYRHIKSISKATTIKLFPNAIEIITWDDTKYFFTSFVSRDRAYKLIRQLWSNCLSDHSMPWSDVCKLIRDSYTTDDLGINLSDIDGADVEINLHKKKQTKKKSKKSSRKNNGGSNLALTRSDSVSSFCTCPETSSNSDKVDDSELDSVATEGSPARPSRIRRVCDYLTDRSKLPNLVMIAALIMLVFQLVIITWMTTVYTRLDQFKRSMSDLKIVGSERLLLARQPELASSSSPGPPVQYPNSFFSLIHQMFYSLPYCDRSA